MLPVNPALFTLFLGVMVVFSFTPGPANLFAIATGVRAGPRAALIGVAGMNAATLVWIAAAALGLGALVAAFPAQFHLIAIAGGLYVGWLGAKSLWAAARNTAPPLDASKGAGPKAAFRDGFAVQIANPKLIVFFTAVLPPFVDPARPILPQLLLLGAAVIGLDVLAMSAYGVAGGALARTLQDAKARRVFAAFVGVLLLGAAALILFRH
jgi:threonine/homoserine/homoserine lactone efflux protein